MLQLLQTAMPPSNLSYLIAAFAITGVAFIGYVYFIFRRRQETQAEIDRLHDMKDKPAATQREGG